MPHPASYADAPFLVIWETTQACALACRHCRAEAQESRDPAELDTTEGFALIDRVAAMGTPIIVFSGGDPLQRDDLEDLIRHAKRRGLRVGTIPAATERCTRERLAALVAAGVDQLALSIDAPTASEHDGFRQVHGSFQRSLEAAAWIRELGVALQVNSAFAAWNVDRFPALAQLVRELSVAFWEVFCLVPTGRGSDLAGLDTAAYERLFARLHAFQNEVDFIVKITEAPHYRAFVARAESDDDERIRALLAKELGPGGSIGQAPRGVNSGKGFLFVSHTGEIFPSGFLPLRLGSVREDDLSTVYREHPQLRALRDPTRLGGRCGACRYRDLCGGSRARAYALTGDPLGEDPDCDFFLSAPSA